ncbi:polysaccharide biosynthesis protein [Candidatus Pelagibacter sp.]|nr:polysaccharide biosynthesis protein [Candidatus Pelagibacter sp.]
MIKNVIFGKQSKITTSIVNNLDDVKIISANNINYSKLRDNSKKKTNYIFNNFYPSFKLNNLNSTNFQKFVDLSIVNLIQILSNLPKKNINKIIYTSSASVYNLTDGLMDTEVDTFNRKLYASFKYSAEKIIQNFCQSKNLKFYIMRIFNTYGDHKDQFSFVEKLIKVKRKNLYLNLINNGISLRDFIHLSDVGAIYKKFLINEYDSGVYDIGTGKGVLIKNLVEFSNIDKKKIINKNNISQINRSIADTKKLQKYLDGFKFKSLDSYLRDKLKIKNKNKLNFTKYNFQITKYEGSVIYGAGFAGKELYLNLKEKKEKIIFFVDDDPKKHNTIFQDIPVISFEDLKKINNKKIIDKVFIAIPSLKKNKIEMMNKKLNNFFFDVRYLPEKKFILNNKINLNDLKIDQINSLINREQIYRKKIHSFKNKNVLVTGAVGTIGHEICRQLVFQKAKKIIGIDHSEIGIYKKKNELPKKVQLYLSNINDSITLNKLIKKHKINLIIHAAAYKHVNILEDNILSAVNNNIFGTKNLCEISQKNNIDFILISTDKAAKPTSILGYTKRASEQLIEFYNISNIKNNIFNIVRFGNVFGSSGSAITKFIDQINNNEPVSITDKKATRFFMTTLEACYLVLETTSVKIKNKIFVLNMGKPINIYQVAKKIGLLKQKLDTSYQFKHHETGLRKNEKLHEILFDRNEKKHKINKNIFYVSRKRFDGDKFIKFYNKLEAAYKKGKETEILSILKIICKI